MSKSKKVKESKTLASVSIRERLVTFITGFFQDVSLAYADSWLRLSAGLYWLQTALVLEAKSRIKDEIEAERYAKGEFQVFVAKSFENRKGFSLKTILANIDVYKYFSEILEDFWAPKDFDKPDSKLLSGKYAEMLMNLSKESVFDMSRELEPQEAKQLLGKLYRQGQSLKMKGFSNAYIYKALQAKTEEDLQKKLDSSGKKTTKNSRKEKKVQKIISRQQIQGDIILPAEIGGKKSKNVKEFRDNFKDYMTKLVKSLEFWGKTKADWMSIQEYACDFVRILDESEESIISLREIILASLEKDGKIVTQDVKTQEYKIESINKVSENQDVTPDVKIQTPAILKKKKKLQKKMQEAA